MSPATHPVAGRALVVAGVLLLTVLVTAPRVPYEWDAASTWIARAEQERETAGVLLAAMRTPGDWPLLMPEIGAHVFPVGHVMIVGALARALPAGVSAKRAADAWLGVLLLLLLWSLHGVVAPEARLVDMLPSLLIFACPFTVVHLRSGYADLFVGVLAATASVCAIRAVEAPTIGRWLAWVAVASVLCQTKTDGVILLMASSAAALAMAARRRLWSWRVAALHTLVPLVNVGGWWLLMRQLYGPAFPPLTRAVSGFELAQGSRFLYEAARHLLDVDTWGWTWGLLLGVAVARRNVLWACQVGVAIGLYTAAHVIGAAQMTHVLSLGIIMNRLLLQVLVGSIPFAWPLAHSAGGQNLDYHEHPPGTLFPVGRTD